MTVHTHHWSKTNRQLDELMPPFFQTGKNTDGSVILFELPIEAACGGVLEREWQVGSTTRQ